MAWGPMGWRPAAVSEIEPFPCHVLDQRQGASRPMFMPSPDASGLKEEDRRARAAAIKSVQSLPVQSEVPNLGDMTQFKEWPDVANVSLLVGGTPCQSFSVAGLRKGLDDPRGNLALTYLAIADRYRPKWVVWENVPGVLSSSGGRDFGSFLGGLGQLGYGWAYRVLDAQYVRARGFPYAVPQRRRRVFVVGYLGDWRRAAAVLFDAQSMRGDPSPRREAGQRLAGNAAQGVAIRGRDGGGTAELSGPRSTAIRASQGGGDNPHVCAPVAARMVAFGEYEVDGTSSAMKARDYKDATDLVASPVAIPINTQMALRGQDTSNTSREGIGVGDIGDPSFTLQAAHCHAVAFQHQAGGDQSRIGFDPCSGVTSTLSANQTPAVVAKDNLWQVRRLTPRECERLQAFPDDYTRIKWRGKPADQCPDGPRYKALGNSMATSVMEWIGERIQMVEDLS